MFVGEDQYSPGVVTQARWRRWLGRTRSIKVLTEGRSCRSTECHLPSFLPGGIGAHGVNLESSRDQEVETMASNESARPGRLGLSRSSRRFFWRGRRFAAEVQ